MPTQKTWRRERERERACARKRGRPTQRTWRRERESARQQERVLRERVPTWERVEESGRETPGPLAPIFLFFFFFFAPPLGLPYVNWASQECCLFYLTSSLRPWVFLCSIFAGFSVPCLLATAILDSFFLFWLPNLPPLKRWGAEFFGIRGVEVFLATSCWIGMARGIGPLLLASLRPQSPYSGVHLRVSDIFRGWL